MKKNTPLRSRVIGGLTAVGSLTAVGIGLAAIDPRVSAGLAQALRGGGTSNEFASAGARGEQLLLIVLQAVRDQSIEHAPLVMFALAAIVLVLFMLRT